MAAPVLLPGTKFRLLRESDTTPGTYEFVCVANTVSFVHNNDYDDIMVADCDDPDAIPYRKSTPKSQSWSLSFSGTADAVRIQKIKADARGLLGTGPNKHSYQILEFVTGGQTTTGDIWIENFTQGKSDNGFVTFSATARGDGAYEVEVTDMTP